MFWVYEPAVVCIHRALNPILFFYLSSVCWCVSAGLVCIKHHLFCITKARWEWEAVAIYLNCITITAAFHLTFLAITLQCQRSWQHKFWINLYEVSSSTHMCSCMHTHTYPRTHTDFLRGPKELIIHIHFWHISCVLFYDISESLRNSAYGREICGIITAPAITLQHP